MAEMTYLEKLVEDHGGSSAFITEYALIHFTDQVLNAMDYSGLSRTDLANKSGLAKAQITRLLRGDHNMTARTMGRIAAALGMKLEINMTLVMRRSAEVPVSILPEAGGVGNYNYKVTDDDSFVSTAA